MIQNFFLYCWHEAKKTQPPDWYYLLWEETKRTNQLRYWSEILGMTAGVSHSQQWHQERQNDDIFLSFHGSNLLGSQSGKHVHCIHYTLRSSVTGWVIWNILWSTWQDWYSAAHPDAELHLQTTMKLFICRNVTHKLDKLSMFWQTISKSFAALRCGRQRTPHRLLSPCFTYKMEIDSINLIMANKIMIACSRTWPFRTFASIAPIKCKEDLCKYVKLLIVQT